MLITLYFLFPLEQSTLFEALRVIVNFYKNFIMLAEGLKRLLIDSLLSGSNERRALNNRLWADPSDRQKFQKWVFAYLFALASLNNNPGSSLMLAALCANYLVAMPLLLLIYPPDPLTKLPTQFRIRHHINCLFKSVDK